MDIEILKAIINEQREDIENEFQRENIIERDVQKVIDVEKTRQTLVVTGVRRSGKSTLAHLLFRKYKYAYINFDDERLEGIKAKELNDVLKAFYELYEDVNFMIFDEIHNVPKWELFITRLHRGKKLIVTGSNSKLLSTELSERLTGRHIDITLFPFSFKEFLKFRGLTRYNIYSTKDVAKIKNKLKEYIERGGFPEADEKRVVTIIYNDIINKDILLRRDIKFRRTFKELARLLVSNFSNKISYSGLKKQVGVKSEHTIKNYLDLLEEVFLVFSVPKFLFKLKEQIKETKKIYVVDSGIINLFGFSFSHNLGRLYENIVAIELFRKKKELTQIFYYEDVMHREVDFVIKQGQRIEQLIQVCYDVSDETTKNREIRALLHASKQLKCKNLMIITDDYEATENIQWFGIKREIKFIPLWKWLLG
jgi:hypothetical protein